MSSVDLLNRLLVVHGRSLPIYLADAAPWVGRDRSEAVEVLQAIAADQRQTVDRIGELIMDEGGRLNLGGFPMEFTSYHDLSMDFMVTKLIERVVIDAMIEEGKRCASVARECGLADREVARKVAQEIRLSNEALIANLSSLR